jgi:hypothetical protein
MSNEDNARTKPISITVQVPIVVSGHSVTMRSDDGSAITWTPVMLPGGTERLLAVETKDGVEVSRVLLPAPEPTPARRHPPRPGCGFPRCGAPCEVTETLDGGRYEFRRCEAHGGEEAAWRAREAFYYRLVAEGSDA